jgi:predicted kinase
VKLLQLSADDPQLVGSEAYTELRRYLDLAFCYCQPRRRFLAITHGLSGSGKSTVAAKLVEASGAVRVRSDVERKRLFGLAPEQRSRPEDAATLYSASMSERTFRRLAELAATVLDAGFSVILDATFLHRQAREDFRQLAQRREVPFAILDCLAEPGAIRERLRARASGAQDASEADTEVMEDQMRHAEPLTDSERSLTVSVDSGASAQELWQGLGEYLEVRSG